MLTFNPPGFIPIASLAHMVWNFLVAEANFAVLNARLFPSPPFAKFDE